MVGIKILFFLLIPTLGFAQQSNLGNWWIYFGNKQISSKWNWHHEVQYRNYNFVGDLEQLLLRTGLGYNLTENNNNIHLGYAFIHSQNYVENSDDKISIDEHRIYQQFITRQNAGRVFWQHRYRFEQRFFSNDFRLRFRYFLALNIPLNNETMTDNTFYISAYNEVFLNTENQIFDRNRLYGGLGFRLNSYIRVELGYMNQFLNQFSRDQLNIIAFVNF
jgi:hypothetical protein